MMTLILDLSPEVENRLVKESARYGVEPKEYAKRVLEENLKPHYLTAKELLRLPLEEQERYLSTAAVAAAPLYAADLALPPAERELTALATIAGADFLEEAEEAVA